MGVGLKVISFILQLNSQKKSNVKDNSDMMLTFSPLSV